jgi:hypothetical protein
MPTIPFTSESTTPADIALRGFDIRADPDKFGMQRAQGGQALGQAAEQTAIMFQGLKNETSAKEADIAMNNTVLKQMFDPHTGYLTKQKGDAVSGYQDAFVNMNKAYEDVRKSLPNDEARRMYDSSAVRSLRSFQMAAADHAARENKSWMINTGESRIQNQIDLNAHMVTRPDEFQRGLNTIADEAKQLAELQGMTNQDEVDHMVRHYQSESVGAGVKFLMPTDLVGARGLFEKAQSDGLLDAPHAAAIEDTLRSHEHTKLLMDQSTEAREMMMAERKLHEKQVVNESSMLARLERGQTIPSSELADAVGNQDISPQAFHAIRSFKEDPGTSDSRTLLSLWQKAGEGNLTSDDVWGAQSQLKTSDAVSLMKNVGKERNTVVQHDFQALKGVLSHGIEQGLIRDPSLRDQIAMLWSNAQGEFWERVNKGEKSTDVAEDLRERYLKAQPRPESFPKPKYGDIPIDSADVSAQAKMIAELHKQGNMAEPEYQREMGTLFKYQEYYKIEDAKAAVRAAEKRTTGKPKDQTNEVTGFSVGE